MKSDDGELSLSELGHAGAGVHRELHLVLLRERVRNIHLGKQII